MTTSGRGPLELVEAAAAIDANRRWRKTSGLAIKFVLLQQRPLLRGICLRKKNDAVDVDADGLILVCVLLDLPHQTLVVGNNSNNKKIPRLILCRFL